MGTTHAELGRIMMLGGKVAALKEKATNPAYVSTDREAIVTDCRPHLAEIVAAMGDN